VRLDASGGLIGAFSLPPDPRRMARDPLDGSLWVTCYSTGSVVHVSAGGGVLATYSGFGGPYGVDVDEGRNVVWVGLDGESAVVALNTADGTTHARVTGISHPRSLAVNDRTGECFVAAIGSHELVRLAADGTVLSRNPDFSAPFDVKIDPGPRN
jgi:DNA-binding beta-propeller fold protein YncE